MSIRRCPKEVSKQPMMTGRASLLLAGACPLGEQPRRGSCVRYTGVNARSVADVKLFNDIFSECGKEYSSSLMAEGLRIGYPKNFWEDIGQEAGLLFPT